MMTTKNIVLLGDYDTLLIDARIAGTDRGTDYIDVAFEKMAVHTMSLLQALSRDEDTKIYWIRQWPYLTDTISQDLGLPYFPSVAQLLRTDLALSRHQLVRHVAAQEGRPNMNIMRIETTMHERLAHVDGVIDIVAENRQTGLSHADARHALELIGYDRNLQPV